MENRKSRSGYSGRKYGYSTKPRKRKAWNKGVEKVQSKKIKQHLLLN